MINSGKPEENFEELLEEFMPSDIKKVIKEKEGNSGREHHRLHEVIDQHQVDAELDLHNHTREGAKRAIGYFIQNSHYNKLKKLRIITGKGTHSEEGRSVLRSIAEEKIIELKKQGLVKSFKWEQGEMAKSGAIIVYLN